MSTLFGGSSSAPGGSSPAPGGLFGASSSRPAASTPAPGGLFGANSSGSGTGASGSGGLFGANSSRPAASTPAPGGLFGASSSRPAAGTPAPGGLFGAISSRPAASTPTPGGLFGASSSGSGVGTSGSGGLFAKQPVVAVQGRRTDLDSALDLTGPVFQIRVGKEGSHETFAVHQKLFARRSDYFAKATNGNFLESEERLIKLENFVPETFRYYIIFVYTSQLATKGPNEWLALCRLYVLAEYLLDRQAKNRVIDGIYAYLTETLPAEPKHDHPSNLFSVEAIQEVYDGTPEDSHLRRLVVDLYAIHGKDLWLKDGKQELPTEFLYDIALKMLQIRPSPHASCSILGRLSSDYHEVSTTK